MSRDDEIDSARAFQITLAVKAHIVNLAARSVHPSNTVIAVFFDPRQPCSPPNLCRHLTLGCLFGMPEMGGRKASMTRHDIARQPHSTLTLLSTLCET